MANLMQNAGMQHQAQEPNVSANPTDNPVPNNIAPNLEGILEVFVFY